jgi:hypothetical protein
MTDQFNNPEFKGFGNTAETESAAYYSTTQTSSLDKTLTQKTKTVISFDMWEACNDNYSTNPLFRHAFRITQHPENQHLFDSPELLEEQLHALSASEFTFQIERGEITQKLHFQGYVKLPSKIRSKQLAKMLNPIAFGIEVTSAFDEKALIRYCQKEETRVEGPWSHLSNLS